MTSWMTTLMKFSCIEIFVYSLPCTLIPVNINVCIDMQNIILTVVTGVHDHHPVTLHKLVLTIYTDNCLFTKSLVITKIDTQSKCEFFLDSVEVFSCLVNPLQTFLALALRTLELLCNSVNYLLNKSLSNITLTIYAALRTAFNMENTATSIHNYINIIIKST